MPDQIISAASPEAGFAIVSATTSELTRELQERHALSPTAAAALGRLATAAAILGSALKDRQRISLQISGDGPIRGLAAEAWLLDGTEIGVRAYAREPRADLPLNERGKFDVGGLVGSGSLQVTRSDEVGQPYVGVVPLVSGEIAEDVAAYLVNSEQIPSVVALGVLADPGGIRAAGGIMAQVLPGADEHAVEALERRALTLPPVTQLVCGGADAESLLHALAGDAPLRAHRSMRVLHACRCSREKVETALLGLGADDLERIAGERAETEASCDFCKTLYVFTAEDLRAIATRLRRA